MLFAEAVALVSLVAEVLLKYTQVGCHGIVAQENFVCLHEPDNDLNGTYCRMTSWY